RTDATTCLLARRMPGATRPRQCRIVQNRAEVGAAAADRGARLLCGTVAVCGFARLFRRGRGWTVRPMQRFELGLVACVIARTAGAPRDSVPEREAVVQLPAG